MFEASKVSRTTSRALRPVNLSAAAVIASVMLFAVHSVAADGPEIEPAPVEAQAAEPATQAQQAAPIAADPMMEAAEAYAKSKGDTPSEGNVAPAAEASAAGQKPVAVAAATHGNEISIYDQWAYRKVSKHEEKKPHPLAAMHPDHFVVVCEAGCAGEVVDIVYMERRDARGPVNEKPLKSGAVAGTESIDCVGGCYQDKKSYVAVPATWDPSAHVSDGRDEESGWMTSQKKASAADGKKGKPVGDGRWYDRIN
jgi:hypothetical protein